ncbi:MAG: MerR family transcriptional regulator [candidate division Zixibacteria bacterium]|nr:MerR family transcriptional regulator [candidate division Zixibacteria bacterium]
MAKSKTGIDEKLYYSISEVARITDLQAYVLRFWEKEFSMLRPRKNKGGNRYYQKRDIDMINSIKQLLYVENYTISGARKQLRESASNPEKRRLVLKAKSKTIIGEIKKELEDILKLFPCLF